MLFNKPTTQIYKECWYCNFTVDQRRSGGKNMTGPKWFMKKIRGGGAYRSLTDSYKGHSAPAAAYSLLFVDTLPIRPQLWDLLKAYGVYK